MSFDGSVFTGWFVEENKVSTERNYSFRAGRDVTILADFDDHSNSSSSLEGWHIALIAVGAVAVIGASVLIVLLKKRPDYDSLYAQKSKELPSDRFVAPEPIEEPIAPSIKSEKSQTKTETLEQKKRNRQLRQLLFWQVK